MHICYAIASFPDEQPQKHQQNPHKQVLSSLRYLMDAYFDKAAERINELAEEVAKIQYNELPKILKDLDDIAQNAKKFSKKIKETAVSIAKSKTPSSEKTREEIKKIQKKFSEKMKHMKEKMKKVFKNLKELFKNKTSKGTEWLAKIKQREKTTSENMQSLEQEVGNLNNTIKDAQSKKQSKAVAHPIETGITTVDDKAKAEKESSAKDLAQYERPDERLADLDRQDTFSITQGSIDTRGEKKKKR